MPHRGEVHRRSRRVPRAARRSDDRRRAAAVRAAPHRLREVLPAPRRRRAAAWRRYWEPFRLRDALAHVGMFTRTKGEAPHAGLYEIVATDARAQDRQAVLVGYSQGGLVARFLAWMDEQLLDPKQRAIAGVVLVQSPNHGSPLADAANADNVSAGLLGILVGLAGYPIVGGADPQTRAAIDALVTGQAPPGSPTWRFGVGAICGILDAAIRDASPKRAGRYDLLRTARKWLTGLSEESPHGVRRSRSGGARRSAHHPGAADGDAAGADLSWRRSSAPTRRSMIWSSKGETASCAGWCATSWPDTGSRRSRSPTRASPWTRAAAHVPRGELHQKIAALYQTGLQSGLAGVALRPFAHDFVIPSVSQALYTLAATGGR